MAASFGHLDSTYTELFTGSITQYKFNPKVSHTPSYLLFYSTYMY